MFKVLFLSVEFVIGIRKAKVTRRRGVVGELDRRKGRVR
jgi:hypothetical protein